MTSLWIPGNPKATQTGSVVRVNGRSFPVRRNTDWTAYVRLVMAQAAVADGLTPTEMPLSVGVVFYLPDLASGKRALPTKRPDLDNLLKGFLDAGNGILWLDDAQIVSLTVDKRYAKHGLHQAPGVTLWWERAVEPGGEG